MAGQKPFDKMERFPESVFLPAYVADNEHKDLFE